MLLGVVYHHFGRKFITLKDNGKRVIILTFLLHQIAAAPEITSEIGLYIYVPMLGLIPGLQGIREHLVRHTLVM